MKYSLKANSLISNSLLICGFLLLIYATNSGNVSFVKHTTSVHEQQIVIRNSELYVYFFSCYGVVIGVLKKFIDKGVAMCSQLVLKSIKGTCCRLKVSRGVIMPVLKQSIY